ncbi:hypothetical protein GCM10009773_08320 [Williamsia serinedens]
MGLRQIIRDMRAGWRGADDAAASAQAVVDAARVTSQRWQQNGAWELPIAVQVCQEFGHSFPEHLTVPGDFICQSCNSRIFIQAYQGSRRL